MIYRFPHITNKCAVSLQFSVNYYLALLFTLLIRLVCHLKQILLGILGKNIAYWLILVKTEKRF